MEYFDESNVKLTIFEIMNKGGNFFIYKKLPYVIIRENGAYVISNTLIEFTKCFNLSTHEIANISSDTVVEEVEKMKIVIGSL